MKILLHICCGVCVAGSAEILLAEGHEITGYYFNPNISPVDEYEKRLQASRTVADIMNFPIIVPLYAPGNWLESTTELSKEPEGGKRCEVCFRIRLQNTYDYMRQNDFEVFTTTLTIGPMKSAETINRLGKEIGGDKFMARDFKKSGGAQRAVALAKQYQIYRQNYCGCVYSLRNERKNS
jgi:predicted adenine nucleotide alpha hydrolase (AANH) superfamily ATPase